MTTPVTAGPNAALTPPAARRPTAGALPPVAPAGRVADRKSVV